MWNKSPFHERKFADGLARVLAKYRDRLGRCDIVTGRPVVVPRGALEVPLNDFLPARKSVAPARDSEITAECHARLRMDAHAWIRRSLLVMLPLFSRYEGRVSAT